MVHLLRLISDPCQEKLEAREHNVAAREAFLLLTSTSGLGVRFFRGEADLVSREKRVADREVGTSAFVICLPTAFICNHLHFWAGGRLGENVRSAHGTGGLQATSSMSKVERCQK